MQDRLDRLEAEVETLSAQLGEIRARLERLERQPTPRLYRPQSSAADTRAPASDQGHAGVPFDPGPIAHTLGLVGRTFLVLCGAFLLRSLTDAGALPLTAGVSLGFAYAAFWLFRADRSGTASRRLSATLSGGAASIVAFPLLWESTARFELLTAPTAVWALAIFTGLVLTVAWRHDLQALAWIALPGALATDLAITVGFRNWPSGVTVALLLGGAALWCGYARGWTALRWPVAIVVDIALLAMLTAALRSGAPGVPEGPASALVLAALGLTLVVYLGSFAIRSLRQRQALGVFEVAQTVAATAIALAGATAINRQAHVPSWPLAWMSILAGMSCYAVGFAFVDRRLGRGRTFLYFTSMALILVVWGLMIMTEGLPGIALLCSFAVAAAVLGGRFKRVTLRAHSALFVTLAFAVAGAPVRASEALVDAVSEARQSVDLAIVIVLATAIVAYLVMAVAYRIDTTSRTARIPSLVMAVVAAVGIAIILPNAVFGLLAPSGGPDPAVVAAIRTALMSLSAIVLAVIGSRATLVELTWIVYPLLAVTGAKLVLEDLPTGRPLTLFLSFAFFGLALIVAPRSLRRSDGFPGRVPPGG
jgi:hypothetical protein